LIKGACWKGSFPTGTFFKKIGGFIILKSKLTAVLTALLLIFAAIPSQAQAATQFSDVDKHWAKKEIMYLSDRNIIGGYPDGTFKPNQPITRAQASAMLIKALEIPLTENTSVEFKDVSKDSPYYKILATVNEKGILRGDDGYMRPGEKTSRAQMAAILRRSFDMSLDKQPTFVDVTPSHWAYQDINGIAKQRVAGGSDGKFMPADSVTRAQFSAFLVRALDEKMKLSSYRSYVSTKGKTVEQDGFSYFIDIHEKGYHDLIKENMATGKREVLLKYKDVPRSNWDIGATYLHTDTRLIVYNEEIFIPYHSGGFAEADEVPFAYAVMKMKTDGQDLEKMVYPSVSSPRNVFIWNDRIFYTNEKDHGTRGIGVDEFKDSTLELYSTAMDGRSDKRKELIFDARATFDLFDVSGNREAGGENLSVLYDHSTIYYFNKKGVFKYSLLDKKTTKLSNVLGKRMEVTDAQLIVTDTNGKKHALKK
jgi:hypothetical protein